MFRVDDTGAVIEPVYDAGSHEVRGVYELGDDLIVVTKSPYVKRLDFMSPSYPEIDSYSYSAGVADVIPYLVMINSKIL